MEAPTHSIAELLHEFEYRCSQLRARLLHACTLGRGPMERVGVLELFNGTTQLLECSDCGAIVATSTGDGAHWRGAVWAHELEHGQLVCQACAPMEDARNSGMVVVEALEEQTTEASVEETPAVQRAESDGDVEAPGTMEVEELQAAQ
jgi:hypothetical protein